MGRYDGEDYGERPSCKLGEHAWMMNGKCSKCRRDVATIIFQLTPAHQRDRDEGRTRFKPPTAFSPTLAPLPPACPLCDIEVRGLSYVDPYGFCWHKACYDEEASVGAFGIEQ